MTRNGVRSICVAAVAAGALVAGAASHAPREASAAERVGTLTAQDSRYYVRRLIRQRAGEGYAFPGSYSIACSRQTRLRFTCRFSAFAGDSEISGSGVVRYTTDPEDDEVHYRIRVRYRDGYCFAVTNPGSSSCDRYARWTN